jgi:hypothetical protein
MSAFRKPDGAGKGDKPRPINDWEQFSNNFDTIFGKKKPEEKPNENSTGHRDEQQP